MAGRNDGFVGGVKSARNNISYGEARIGNTIHADATDDEGNTSYAQFEFDPGTQEYEVKDGTLELHPAHQGKGVGQMMRRRVNLKYKA